MAIQKRKDGRRTVFQATDRTRGFSSISCTFDSRSEAKAWLTRVRAERQRGSAFDPAQRRAMTLAEAVQWYMETITPTKAGCFQEKKRAVHLLRYPFMQMKLGEVLPHHLTSFVQERQAAGISGSTIRKDLSFLSDVYNWVRLEFRLYAVENPVSIVKKPSCARPRQRRLTDEEEAALLEYFETKGNPEMRPLIIVAIETGLRKSELLRLEWADIDFKKCWATVAQSKKGRVPDRADARRGFPLSKRAIDALLELRNRQIKSTGQLGFTVFTITSIAIDLARAKALKATGIKNWRLHDARHETASRLYTRGLEQEFIKRVLGHTSLDMTRAYQTFMDGEIQKAFKRTDEGSGSPPPASPPPAPGNIIRVDFAKDRQRASPPSMVVKGGEK